MTEHEVTLDALPWYVNNTLEARERASVEAHLSGCAECRRELALLRAMARAEREPDREPLPDLVDRVMDRIGPPRESLWRRLFAPGSVWWPRLAVAELALLVALAAGVVVLSREVALQRAGYEALTGEQQEVAGAVVRLRVAFDENVRLGEMRAALEAVGARIVSGPSAVGFYVVSVRVREGQTPGQALEQAAALLRGRANVVRFVEAAP
jgi:anti-sigma factor RsiW